VSYAEPALGRRYLHVESCAVKNQIIYCHRRAAPERGLSLLLKTQNPPNAVAKYVAKSTLELEERETGLEPATLSLEG
jgi:hypothetical protein